MSKQDNTVANVIAAVSLISSLFKDINQIIDLFSVEDISKEEVEKILKDNRQLIKSRIENETN